MRQHVFRSAYVYCQIVNYLYLRNIVILYKNGKKGESASIRRDRERECVRDGESLKMRLASVLKWPLEEGLTILRVQPTHKDYVFPGKLF
jgi:hypothetical protein